MIVNPFNPHAKTNVAVTTAVASASTAISRDDMTIRVYNNHASVPSHICLGDSRGGTVTITATTADLVLGPGHVVILYKNGLDTIAYLRSGGSDGSLTFSTGNDGTN